MSNINLADYDIEAIIKNEEIVSNEELKSIKKLYIKEMLNIQE